jgi:DNA-binding NarL/FixJ family response regulator
MEAVRRAEELKPDLILLDVGLPTLNGIEVARRVCRLSHECKRVFVSQESSADVVQEAFRSGASGYVVKSRAGIDLLPAVEAVLENRHFVSSGLLGHNFTSTADAQGGTPIEVNEWL